MREDVDRYVRQCQVEGWSEGSADLYRHQLEVLVRFLQRRGCRRTADVVPGDLDAFMEHLRGEGYARSTRVQIAHTVRRFFRALQDEGRIVACPARTLPIPEDGEEVLPQPPLTEAEVVAIIDGLPRDSAIDLRNRAILELLYGCGLRRAEAVGLSLDDLDVARRTLHIRNSKHAQDRLLPILGTALAAVKDWLAMRRTLLRGPDTGALFIGAKGRRLTTSAIDQWFGRLNEARGHEARLLHPHLFRHSITVHLLQGGADIRYIQQFLGHGDLETTKIYLRLVPGRLKEEYDKAMPEIAVGL